MQAEPLVSVLMPAYNNRKFIGAAIESVLAQTYTHFELLIIDDGSTDETSALATTYGDGDPRVRIYPQPHAGIAEARNRALSLAQGEVFAWLDADDLARPRRLEQQLALILKFPQLLIVGSAYQVIDEHGVSLATHKMPASDTMIRWHCLFHSPFAQSSVMLRKEVLRSNRLSYDPVMEAAEDYDLWSRLLEYGQGYNISEPLVEYRLHPGQVSQRSQILLEENAGRVARRNLIALGTSLPVEQVQKLREWFFNFPARLSDADLPLAEAFLEILNRFSDLPGLEAAEVGRLRGRWLGRSLRAGLRSRNMGGSWRLLRRFKSEDWRLALAYLRSREKS